MNAIGLAAMLLLAAQSDAQVRGSVKTAQTNPLPVNQPLSKAILAPGQLRNPAWVQTNSAQSFQAPRLINNAPMVISNGGNGYAAVMPVPFVANGPNGYAAPAPTVDPYALCDAKWRVALRREIMNPDNWQCAKRMAADGSMEDCVITGPFSGSMLKNISACGWSMPVFCDNSVTDLMMSLVTPSSANVTAPAGYTLIAGSGYYKVHSTPLTWDEAKIACEAEVTGGRLALINKPSDYQPLLDMVNAAVPVGHTTGAFIGYTDVALEGTFLAVTGQPSCMLGKLIYFGGSANNFGGNENCLTLGYSGQPNLNDDQCAKPMPFICQLPLPSNSFPC